MKMLGSRLEDRIRAAGWRRREHDVSADFLDSCQESEDAVPSVGSVVVSLVAMHADQ